MKRLVPVSGDTVSAAKRWRAVQNPAGQEMSASASSATQQGAAGQGTSASPDQDTMLLTDFCEELNQELQEEYPSVQSLYAKSVRLGAAGQSSAGRSIRVTGIKYEKEELIINDKYLPARYCISYERCRPDLGHHVKKSTSSDKTLNHYMHWFAYDRTEDHAHGVVTDRINSTTADHLRDFVLDFLAPITLMKSRSYHYDLTNNDYATITLSNCYFQPRDHELEWYIKVTYSNGDSFDLSGIISDESECADMIAVIKKNSWSDLFKYLQLDCEVEEYHDDLHKEDHNKGERNKSTGRSIFNPEPPSMPEKISQDLMSIFAL